MIGFPGETKEEMFATLDVLMPLMPENKVRYLMGVGSPLEMLRLIPFKACVPSG
jgi:queuine tRNA-ribosyltransferase